MKEELEEFNNILLNLYLRNLDYLKKSQTEVYNKVIELDKKIEKGEYLEKYSLEYKEEGYFDIYDNNKKDFIYGFNSYEEADKRRDLVNFSQHHSLNMLRVDPRNNKFALMSSLGSAIPLVDYLNKKINFENITFSKIFKFIFIGVGVGVHIHEIYKKIDSMNTLIIEPDVELFKISLFTIDYSIFEEGNKKLFLSIGENVNQRESSLANFAGHHSYMNYNMKHHLFWIQYKYILDEMIDFFLHHHAASFSYNSVLNVFSRTVKYINEGHKFCKKDLINKYMPLKDQKVLIIGAGPSVDTQIEWIKKNQNKFIIICVDKITQKLEKENVKPDIIVSIDPSKIIEDLFIMENDTYLKESSIVFLSQQHPDVLEKVKDLNFYFSQVMPVSSEVKYFFSFPNVGTFGLAFAIFIGAEEIYLTGNDAAFNQETGKTFASDTLDMTGNNLENNESQKNDIISESDILEIKGNLRPFVKSTRKLLTFKRDYESFIHSHSDSKAKIYNLSDGVFIEGLIPLDIKDLDTSQFRNKKFNPIEELNNISSVLKRLDFQKDIIEINSIITRVNSFKKTKITNKDQFLEKKLDIMIWILEKMKKMKNSTFGNLFLQYTDLVDIYINFTLNLKQKDISEKETLMRIKEYWCITLIGLLKEIKDTIKGKEVNK